jgi:hypothetical protein
MRWNVADRPTYDFSDEGIESAIQALDGRPNEVAAVLSAGGWRGVKGNECDCPVARYVGAHLPGGCKVFVYLDEDGDALVIAERQGDGHEKERVGSVAFGGIPEFVRRFDRGLYPDLIEEASDAVAH